MGTRLASRDAQRASPRNGDVCFWRSRCRRKAIRGWRGTARTSGNRLTSQNNGEPPMNEADVFKGIRVVDFSQGMAGPYCGHLLAQYGADVVKVEPPVGDWLRTNGKQFGDHSAMSLVAGRG